jgi:hypothetical protein
MVTVLIYILQKFATTNFCIFLYYHTTFGVCAYIFLLLQIAEVKKYDVGVASSGIMFIATL